MNPDRVGENKAQQRGEFAKMNIDIGMFSQDDLPKLPPGLPAAGASSAPVPSNLSEQVCHTVSVDQIVTEHFLPWIQQAAETKDQGEQKYDDESEGPGGILDMDQGVLEDDFESTRLPPLQTATPMPAALAPPIPNQVLYALC